MELSFLMREQYCTWSSRKVEKREEKREIVDVGGEQNNIISLVICNNLDISYRDYKGESTVPF